MNENNNCQVDPLEKPLDRDVLSTAMVAFLPQFAFLHATVSNDPLVIFLVTFSLWQLLRMWYASITPGQLHWRDYLSYCW